MFCKRVESRLAPHLLTMQIRGQPSPAEILDIVLEGELLGIGEPLGGGEVDEEESREEKQHLGRKLSVEIVPLVHRKCISGIWLNQFRKYLPRPVISKLSVSVRNSTIANLECMYKADFAAIGANQRRRSQSASSKSSFKKRTLQSRLIVSHSFIQCNHLSVVLQSKVETPFSRK